MTDHSISELSKIIRDITDFPKPGIIFKDITTLLKSAEHFQNAIDLLTEHYKTTKIDKIAAIEARGFIIGAAMAFKLECGFIPLRKPGKLPAASIDAEYELEYGTDRIEVHRDAIAPNEKILLVDDLIATGGSARAAVDLIEKLRGEVLGICFLVELSFLKGRNLLEGYNIFSLITYDL